MAIEIFAIPEENLKEVIKIIQVGLDRTEHITGETISPDVQKMLSEWCEAPEEYLRYLGIRK